MGLIIAPQRFFCLTQFFGLHNSILLKVSHPFNQGPLKKALHLILVFRNPGKKWLFCFTTHMNSYTFVVIYFLVQGALAFFEIPQKNWLLDRTTHMNSYTFVVIYYIVQRALAFFGIPKKNWLFGSQHIWIRIHLLLFF